MASNSAYAWRRLAYALAIATIGGVGMWSVVVALPAIQAEFGVDRADASLPYTLVMLGFGFGGILMGRLADRFGIAMPLTLGTLALGSGYVAVGLSTNLWQVALAHGLLIGVGASVTFGPLMAEMSHWFMRRRGIAVALAASGNYTAGTIWPPVVQHFIAADGWRATHIGIGLFCVVTMLPLAFALRRRLASVHSATAGASAAHRQATMPFSPAHPAGAALHRRRRLLRGDGDAAGAHRRLLRRSRLRRRARRRDAVDDARLRHRVSRVASGFIADRIGGVRTLLLGSLLQGVALLLYLMFDGLFSLYVISALFGLFQGGIVPMYAIIIREYFSPKEAGARVGLVIMATVVGMALGRLAVGRDLRRHRLLPGRLPQRARLEPGQCLDHGMAAAALPARAGLRRRGCEDLRLRGLRRRQFAMRAACGIKHMAGCSCTQLTKPSAALKSPRRRNEGELSE